ncbi:MAG: ABC transporter permease [Chloroflexi bacterium]|nr:ABC transporter permease [Chloroflexota bacterium]
MSVLGVSYRSYRVWQRNRDVVFRLWFVELVPSIFGPLIVLTALGLGLGVFVELEGDQEYIEFLTPGMLALFPMLWAMFDCGWGAYGRMNMQGIYDAVIATPLNVEDVIAGEIFFGATRGSFQAVHILIAALLFTPAYGLIDSPLAVLTIPLALLAGILFGAMAMCFTSVAPSMSAYNFLWAFIISPMFWFGGAFYPLDRLPAGMQIVAQFIPLTHIVAINRGLIEGQLEWSHLGNLAYIAAAAAGFFALALWSMRRRLIK